MNEEKKKKILAISTTVVGVLLLVLIFLYPELPINYFVAVLFLVLLGALVWINQQALRHMSKQKTFQYGTNAMLTVGLVLVLVVVLNFLNYNHFYRKDFTKNQAHSLSEQSIKIVKELNQDLKFIAFVKTAEREGIKATVDKYLYYTKKISVEYVDPDRDPNRAKTLNVKKYGTIIIQGSKRETRVDEVTEEKITNGLLKVIKEKPVTVCFITGHGERSLDNSEAEGISQVKKDLSSQNYDAKTLNLLEDAKIASDCSMVAIIGPNKPYFEKEIDLIRGFLDGGGRVIVALDPNVKSEQDDNKELKALLDHWYIKINHNLILDPTSRLLGVNASVPIVGLYSKESVITRDFQVTTLFPMASSIEIKANNPTSLRLYWLAKSTPKSFAKTNFKEIMSGQVTLDPKKDVPGPHILMVAAEGNVMGAKPPEGRQQPKLVVLATSQLLANRWASHAANSDLFMNAISWLADDDSLISIRAKDDNAAIPSLSELSSRFIQLLTLIFIPGSALIAGVVVWVRRRKL